jgi:riboflavin biosynthesis pyrimidine reductase
LVDYRCTALGLLEKQPLQLVLSVSCNIDFNSHPLFNSPDLCVVVLTSEMGKSRAHASFSNRIADCTKEWNTRLAEYDQNTPFIRQNGTVTFVSFPENTDGLLDLSQVLLWLRQNANIRRLDVSAGGSVIRHLVDLGKLDEIRITQTGQIIGWLSSVGRERPSLFPKNERVKSYGPRESPLVAWKGVRLIGEHFIFLRGVLEYRNS